jgi:hypothetical protein
MIPPRGRMAGPELPEEWTDDQRRAFGEALRARRGRQARAGRAVAVALMVLVAAGVLLRVPEAWWLPVVGAVAVGGLAYRLVNWKCPSCGEWLPTRGGRTCHGCGAPLDE